MTRLSGGGPPGVKRPPGADPPRWLLALGFGAVGLLLAGMLVGGALGGWLVALACLALPALFATFLTLLTGPYLRRLLGGEDDAG